MPSRMMSVPLQQRNDGRLQQESVDDVACTVKLSPPKRKMCDCPESPTPSLEPESSRPSSSNKRRRVSFDVDEDNKPKTRLNTFDRYEGDVANDVWWSQRDLKRILKREGRLVLNLKIDASKNGDGSCMANALKQSINETFKKCADAPLPVDQNTPSIFEFIHDDDEDGENVPSTTTTRGLERYIAPIMGAHREMVVKSLLITQGQLSNADPNHKMKVLGSRYQHLSKIAANFAVVMGQCDEQLAVASYGS
jgi:hypothetical protein